MNCSHCGRVPCGVAKMLRVPVRLLNETFRVFRDCGQGRNECVVYWTGPADFADVVDQADHPVHHRSPMEYTIDDAWLTRYWFHLGQARRVIRAQIHTHPGAAFHSITDDEFPVISQASFLSIVIPRFAQGTISFDDAWVGQLNAKGQWLAVPHGSVIEVAR